MSLTPRQISERLGPREFIKVCGMVDKECKEIGIKFNIVSIIKELDHVTVNLITDNGAFKVEL